MYVKTEVEADIAAPPERVFDAANDLERVEQAFVAYGLVPGTVRAEVIGGAALAEGVTRRVYTDDGGTVEEQLLVFDRPRAVSYNLTGIARPFSYLVSEATADWCFAAAGSGTHVRWRYAFELTTPLAWGLAAPLIALMFRGWMKSCLHAIGDIAEARPVAHAAR